MWWTSVLAILGLAAFIGGQKEALLLLIIWIAWPLLRHVIQNLRDNSRREEREEALPVPLEKEELSLLGALEVPKGPSALARELGWPKSTVAKRLRRLVSRGLVEGRDGVYRRAERASA
jgi:uncharacterized membrane protein